jgi:hypothetical protein
MWHTTATRQPGYASRFSAERTAPVLSSMFVCVKQESWGPQSPAHYP